MPVQSARSRSTVILQVLLAAIFLATIGASLGYLAARRELHRVAQVGDNIGQGQGQGRGNGNGSGNGRTPGTGGHTPNGPRCPAHTETLAAVGPLHQLLYLHTSASEVWICQDGSGTLYYQGHAGPRGQALVEGTNALFLSGISREGDSGYVAVNTDQKGQVTEYHVTPQQLVVKFVNYAQPKPDRTENAVAN